MTEEKIYDVAVVGGGLAGLTFAVLMAKQGRVVILFEKEQYPFHKVCGEYISTESWRFLTEDIGVPLTGLKVPMINKLLVTSPNGNSITTTLDTGGFGISRYLLDNTIKNIAEKNGVTVKDNCKVENIIFSDGHFTAVTKEGIFKSRYCCGSWGKRSNIDIKWDRPFTEKKNNERHNYVGIKYHVKGNFPGDMISLHNFKDGYCGFSKVEDDKFCLCYFMKASNLAKGGHAVEHAEAKVLSENPHLAALFSSAIKVNERPVTISQVSLSKKSAVENHVLLLGDAAGMISPLCGNGMSIAMRSAKIAAGQAESFLSGKISRQGSEKKYAGERKRIFGKRIFTGRIIQSLFGGKAITNIFVRLMKKNKWLTRKVISLTHGESF